LEFVLVEIMHTNGSVSIKVVPVLLTEHHTTKAYWESRGIASHILWPRH